MNHLLKLFYKYTLISFLLFNISCSAQPSKNQPATIDTVKLFDPYPQTINIGLPDSNIFNHYIALIQNQYYLKLQNEENIFQTRNKAFEFIFSHKNKIKKNKYYIVIDNHTTFSEINSVITFLKENEITDYRVINPLEYLKPQEPTPIQAPVENSQKVLRNDSAFTINIKPNNISVNYLNKDTTFKNETGFDGFIEKARPRGNDIYVVIGKSDPNKRFKKVLVILSKYKYSGYKLETTESN